MEIEVAFLYIYVIAVKKIDLLDLKTTPSSSPTRI